jgi:ribose transport system permease protein
MTHVDDTVSPAQAVPSKAPEAPPDRRAFVSGVARRVARQREIGVITALLALCLYGAVGTQGFLSTKNLLNVGQQGSLVGIMAVGMTFVIITGEIDLSVGSIYALASLVGGQMLTSGVAWPVALLVAIVIGAAAGLANGLIVIRLGLPSFIVTLGTLSVFRGLALLLTGGNPVTLDQSRHNIVSFSYLGQGQPLGVPMQLLIFLAAVVLGGFVLRYTRFGYHVYAVGGNREAARLCGIAVGRVRVAAFVASGALSALAGMLGLSFLLYGDGTTGTGLELSVISAVIIGGAALFGGSGTMVGTLVGVFLIAALQNVLVLAGLSSYWQTIVIGVVIVTSVALDAWVRRRHAGRR